MERRRGEGGGEEEDLEAKKWADRDGSAGRGEEIKRWRSSKFLCNSFPPESSKTCLVPVRG